MYTPAPVQRKQVLKHADGTFTAEASDLGWKNWPLVIRTEKNKTLTLAHIHRDREGDIQFAEYNYKGKLCLTVFND